MSTNTQVLACLSVALLVLLQLPAGGAAEAGGPAIVPMPQSVSVAEGSFTLTERTVIIAGNNCRNEAGQLRDYLAPATGYPLRVRPAGRSRPRNRGPEGSVIRLVLKEELKNLGDEGYELEVKPEEVVIEAAGPAGLFHGIQTLRQLLPASIFRSAPVEGAAWTAPCVRIEDKPRFAWRGTMLDTARHFMPKEFILKYIDLLALQKMNSLHLHLTDDQGWRVQIDKYPKLTEVGAWRKETRVGHASREPVLFDGMGHGGFYSKDDIREIVAYGEQRHVSIVPEIEMPGHAQAAIAAYPELGNLDEKLEVYTTWGVNPNVFNAEPETITFLQDVLAEVMELFPGKFIHVGGDECPKGQWQASEKAQARIKDLGLKNEHELQSYFIKQMDTFLDGHGRRLIGWDEILEGGLAPKATVMSWRGEEGGIAAAKAGHDVVMAPTSYTYFDYYQAKPEGEPLAIGGFLPLERVYGYDPIPKELSEEEAGHILGVQAQLWTEYIGTPKKAEYMAFPRLTALAEIAWTQPAQKDYKDFVERLAKHLERLKALDVNYRGLD